MKTIKIKVSLSTQQKEIFNQYIDQLEWFWNLALANQFHNHCIKWYEWAKKQQQLLDKTKENLDKLKPEQKQLVLDFYSHKYGEKQPKLTEKQKDLINKFEIFSRWLPFDLDGIIPVPLLLGNSGYEGLSCRIAIGGPRWVRDENINIPLKNKKGEIIHKKGSKLVPGKHPYQPIKPTPHSYKTFPGGKFAGRELVDVKKLDNLDGLNSIRSAENLPPLTVPTDYIGGTMKFFEVSWNAFLDPKLPERRKVKFKDKERKLTTLSNNQKPPNRINPEKNTVSISGIGEVKVIDRNWLQRLNLENISPRTYTLSKKPSGYYLNIVVAHPLQEEKSKLDKQLPKVKKEYGEESQEYQEILSKYNEVSEQIKLSYFDDVKDLSVGIDPGVNAVISTDHGALFMPNITRERISIHIEELQSELNKIKDINDAQWKAAGNKGERPKTKNEIKLQAQISRLHEKGANSANCFNHKLSTRIARTYRYVCWEDTKIKNLLKQVEPQALPEGVGYAHNGASAKRGLNWIMRQRCLSDLEAKTKEKVEKKGGKFNEPSANYSSQLCHCCQQKGERVSQHEFICKNPECSLFEKVQQADVNAARNHKQHGGFEVGEVKYNLTKLQYQKPKRFKKKKLTK
jgi:hypothetical protein